MRCYPITRIWNNFRHNLCAEILYKDYGETSKTAFFYEKTDGFHLSHTFVLKKSDVEI